uniref:Uncharacterized protein n=1 Tax=Oryza punctata TaxID=4537 RepID=A0A0E0JMY7_ORYPU
MEVKRSHKRIQQHSQHELRDQGIGVKGSGAPPWHQYIGNCPERAQQHHDAELGEPPQDAPES